MHFYKHIIQFRLGLYSLYCYNNLTLFSYMFYNPKSLFRLCSIVHLESLYNFNTLLGEGIMEIFLGHLFPECTLCKVLNFIIHRRSLFNITTTD